MADAGHETLVSKNETSVTVGNTFPRIKLRSMVRSRKPVSTSENAKLKTSNKDRMKLYRMRLKENPEVYKSYREIANAKNRAYRAGLNEHQKAEQREKTRLRVQKWREKKKLEKPDSIDETLTPKTKPRTRYQSEKLREQWRTSKQKQRANMTSQKKRRINEKRREKYAETKKPKEENSSQKKESIQNSHKDDPLLDTRSKNTELFNTTSKNTELPNTGYISMEAERKAVFRAKQSIPSSPGKFAKVMTKLAKKATPRKKEALESEGLIFLTPSKRRLLDMSDKNIDTISKEMHDSRRRRSREFLQRRRLLAKMMPWSRSRGTVEERNKFGVSWKFITKASEIEGVWEEKKRKDGLDDETLVKVEEFFKQPGVSVCLPDKKLVQSKTMEPRHVMEQSLQMTYEQFKEQNPDCHVGFSKFAALRPRSVKTMKNNLFNNCLCEYCTNMEMKASAINKQLQGNTGNTLGFLNKYELSMKSLCPKQEGELFYRKECINRTCSKCGVEELKSTLNTALMGKTIVNWNKWENETYTDRKTGKKKSRKILRSKSDTVCVFLKELCEELQSFSSHLHNAQWQHKQFSSLVKEIPKNWVVMCMDFAENYNCIYQDEAQSAHWSHDQATLFSIVAYYRCKDCKDIVNESLMFISDDKKHDSHAVYHFVTLANDHLTKNRNLTIDREIHFSDGAASQFKSKIPFADVAKSTIDFGFPCDKHFFGSRHGKGPCDGEFGVVKRTVSQGVAARQHVVRNAEEFYHFAKEKLTKPKPNEDLGCSSHKRRAFFYVSEIEVSRQRMDLVNVKQIPETRKQHAVKPCDEGTLGVATRTLSCFCTYCTGIQTESACQSASHVDDWEPQGVLKTPATKSSKMAGNSQSCKKACSRIKRNTSCRKITAKTGKQDTDIMDISTENKESSHAKVETLTEPCSEINFHTESQTRAEYFREALAYLQSSKTFEELQNKSTTLMKDQKYIDYKTETDHKICIINQCLVADSVAFRILPEKNLPEESKNRLPVRIIGDGNCLPRSVSVACFGHENAYQEIRARIVVEMCTNINTYTDNDYLNKGVTLPENEAINLVKTYAMFSDEYTPGERLTKSVIKRIFQAEALKVVEDGAFMGIWQLFCVASILGVKLLSIYPDLGDWLPKLVLHRTILPRAFRTHQSEILIMWTSNREDLEERNWVPNHFVPLIPQCADSDVMIEFDAEGVDENFSDISLNDSLVEDIITLLADTDLPQKDDLDLPPSAETDLPPSAETDLPPSAETELPHSSEEELPTIPVTVADLPPRAEEYAMRLFKALSHIETIKSMECGSSSTKQENGNSGHWRKNHSLFVGRTLLNNLLNLHCLCLVLDYTIDFEFNGVQFITFIL